MNDLDNTQSFPSGLTPNDGDKNKKGGKKKPKKRKKKKKIFIWIIVIIVIIILGLIGGGYYYATSSLNNLDRVSINLNNLGINKQVDTQLNQFKGITNIVIFGVDEPKGTPGRSDTIMIATIDQNNDTLRITSIMRDSYVNIPGYGMDKINAAYAFGGPELALKTLNEDFGMNLRYYVTEDFTTLPTLVNMLGGVTVNLTQDEINAMKDPQEQLEYIFKDYSPALIQTPGTYKLDGIQAMAYCRIRDGVGGDYARTYRQRQILQQLYTKIKAMPVTEIPGMIDKMLPTIQTNLTNSEIMNLGADVLKMGVPKIEQARLPLNTQSHGEMISGEWYLVINQQETNQNLHDFIYENKQLPNPEYDN
ncbi:MAG: LCP family protein [Sarcina sp.]